MTKPLSAEQIKQLAEHLRPRSPRGMAVPFTPPERTPAQWVDWMAELATVINERPFIPLATETIREPDGTLTIRVTPQ